MYSVLKTNKRVFRLKNIPTQEPAVAQQTVNSVLPQSHAESSLTELLEVQQTLEAPRESEVSPNIDTDAVELVIDDTPNYKKALAKQLAYVFALNVAVCGLFVQLMCLP